jgi:SSS family solute:Na+ symporter
MGNKSKYSCPKIFLPAPTGEKIGQENCWARIYLAVLIFSLPAAYSAGAEAPWLNWTELPSFPDSPGVVGPFVGVSNGALIVAGGASYPAEEPSRHGPEAFSDSVFVLVDTGKEAPEWRDAGKLLHPVAYGAAVTTDQGVICLGGRDHQKSYRSVILLRWDRDQQTIEIDQSLPALPESCHRLAAALVGTTIYVAGGMNNHQPMHVFWSLELATDPGSGGASSWQTLPTWPGAGRYGVALAAQSNGAYQCLYMFGGRGGESGKAWLRDAFRYDPHETDSRQRWQPVTPIPRGAFAAPVMPVGQSHVLVLGGWDGRSVGRQPAVDETGVAARDVLAYHTITDTWAKVSAMPQGLADTTAALWGSRFVIPVGRCGPEATTAKTYAWELVKAQHYFAALDYVGLVAYIVVLVAVGLYFSKRERSTERFFLGGRQIPWWAAGLSILATGVSSIGFMAIPAKSYATDWVYFVGVPTWFIVVPIVTRYYIPLFQRLNVTTAYEYLEVRFNVATRLVGSTLFSLMQLGRMAGVMYMPALALSAVTGFSPNACILVMGVLCTAYTILGGIEAVIWTDVMQALVLLAGGMLCVVVVMLNIDGGIAEFARISMSDHKFHMFNLDWGLTTAALWLVVTGNVASRLALLTSDQTVVQRYLTTKDAAAAKWALWADIAAGIPWALIVFALGTALYVFYKTQPTALNPTVDTDGILPLFIAQQLPRGVGGLLIAAIFAAAMSSLDSSIHSVATVVVTDFYGRFRPESSDHTRLVLARWLVGVLGVFGTATALWLASADIKSLWDFFIGLFGLFIGPLSGLFVLGMFTHRTHGQGALIGVTVSGMILFLVWRFTHVHVLLYAAIGTVSCVAIGYLASLVLPRARPDNGSTRPQRG